MALNLTLVLPEYGKHALCFIGSVYVQFALKLADPNAITTTVAYFM